MLTIRTGGQSGVDEGAISGALSAHREGFSGEWRMDFPKGWKRESPMHDWMVRATELYPKWAKELSSDHYGYRTRHVMNHSDAVLMIEPPGNNTPGSRLTRSLVEEQNKPLWVFKNINNKAGQRAECGAIAYWLGCSVVPMSGIKGIDVTLMVAGPRSSKWAEGGLLAHFITSLVVQYYHDSRKEFQQ